MAGVVLIVVVLAVVPERHQSVAFVFGQTLDNSGFGEGSFWSVFGFVLLVAVTFAVPDVRSTLDVGANAVIHGAALILFGGWYLLSARTWFTGPVPDASIDDELRWSVDRHRRSDR